MSDSVYITGMNVITPISDSLDVFWENIISPPQEGLEKQVIDIDGKAKPLKITRRMNRISKGAFLSTMGAFEDRELTENHYDPFDVGCIVSATMPSLDSLMDFLSSLYDHGANFTSPVAFSNTVANSCVANLAIKYKLKGPSNVFVSSTGLQNACLMLQHKRAAAFLVGGYEDFTDEILRGYNELPYTHKEQDGKVSLYSPDSDGMYVKERMVSFILEREGSPYLTDKSKIYCSIEGTSTVRKEIGNTEYTLESFVPSDFERSMKLLLEKNNIKPSQITAVVGAASGFSILDQAELTAIKNVFGDKINILSVKDIYGDCQGTNIFLNVATGAMILKNSVMSYCFTPENMEKSNKPFEGEYIIANGYCAYGNVMSILLKKY